MVIRTINNIKYDGNYILPNSELDVPESIAQQLVENGAAEYSSIIADQEKPDEDPEDPEDPESVDDYSLEEQIEELMAIDGVTKEIAEALITADISSIESIQGSTIAEVAKINGISKPLAKKLIENAKDIEITFEGDE